MTKKSWPILYCNQGCKMGQDFLDIHKEYTRKCIHENCSTKSMREMYWTKISFTNLHSKRPSDGQMDKIIETASLFENITVSIKAQISRG